jgi:type VI protein secretion system component VasF
MFWPMADGDSKRERTETDPARLAQLLEIELMQKRAAWQQAKARRGSLRTMSFLFLFLVIVAALVAFYLFFSPERVSELRSNAPHAGSPPAASPR